MAIKPIKAIRRQEKSELTDLQTEHLIKGFCLCDSSPFESDVERRRAWKKNRKYLLSLRNQICTGDLMFQGKPWYQDGQRPQAFYEYELGLREDDCFFLFEGEEFSFLKERGLLEQGEVVP